MRKINLLVGAVALAISGSAFAVSGVMTDSTINIEKTVTRTCNVTLTDTGAEFQFGSPSTNKFNPSNAIRLNFKSNFDSLHKMYLGESGFDLTHTPEGGQPVDIGYFTGTTPSSNSATTPTSSTNAFAWRWSTSSVETDTAQFVGSDSFSRGAVIEFNTSKSDNSTYYLYPSIGYTLDHYDAGTFELSQTVTTSCN